MKSLFVEFKDLLSQYGLEYFNKYYGYYRGIVYDNKDPQNQGRLRIMCPQVYPAGESPDYWAYPIGMPSGKDYGFYSMPSIGDPIWIMFEGGNTRFPIWSHGWWAANQLPDAAKRKEPTNHIFQSPKGQRIEFDDEKGLVVITNKKGFKVVVNEKGVFLGKGDNNMNKFLKDLFSLFSSTTVTTALGPEPFINVAEYETLKEKIDLFLTDSEE